ncbi:MAG TPA: tetratricopeptide repeat protein [Solirubrobacteraceae bacterium]
MHVSSRPLATLVAVALLAITGSLAGCSGPDARRAAYVARGQQYLADGKLEKARIEFANALQIAPQNPQARYLLGRVMERLGDVRGAAGMYQGAIEVDPEQREARAGLARLYVLTGHAEMALPLIEPTLARQPDNTELLIVRGLARLRLKDPTGALADAERAVHLSPSDSDAVSALAAVYSETGQPERAVTLLSSAIERAPEASALRQFLAGMYVARGEDKLAETQLREVVQIRPKELAPRLQLAALYTRTQRLDEAERTLGKATADLSSSEQAKLAYADFLVNHSTEKSEESLRALIAQDPRNLDLQLALGALEQRAGRAPEAVATYQAIITRDPEGPKSMAARDRIAAIDVVAGRKSEARSLLAEALERNPQDNDALVLRANLALGDGDPVSAIADLRVVLRDQPRSVSTLRSLARAHLANRSPALAEESLRTALAAAPQDVGVRVDLGELLARTQRADEAAALLEETVKTSPAGAAVRTALIEAYLDKGDLAAARGAAEQLKSARPGLPVGSYLAGLIAERQHRPEDAQRELEHALELQPSAIDALAALARLELGRGHGARAVALVRAASERMPANAEPYELLGEVYIAQKSNPAAIAALREAVRLAPKWWLPYRNLALTELAEKDTAAALAAYDAGVKATGEPALVVDLAEVYLQQGRIDDAIRQYEALHQRRPTLEVASNNLAMLLVTYHHDQASLNRARDLTAAFAASGAAELLDTYGWVRLERGDVREALTALERASEEKPDSKVILYHLGMAYLKAGQAEKARTTLEAALAGGASFMGTQEARLALAQLKGAAG